MDGGKDNAPKLRKKVHDGSCQYDTVVTHIHAPGSYICNNLAQRMVFDGDAELELNVPGNLCGAERTTMCLTCYCNIGLSGYQLTAVVRLIWLVHAVTASGRVRVRWSTHARMPIGIVHCVFPRGRRAEVVLRGRNGRVGVIVLWR